MRKLRLMIFRDIKSNLGQYVAVIVVIIIGISLYNALYMSYHNLKNSTDYYYSEYRLPHIFVRLNRCPEGVISRISAIEGVSQVQGRIVRDVSLDVPGYGEKAYARIISVPTDNKGALCRLFIEEGRYITGPPEGKVLVEKQFFEYHGLKTGDVLYPVINGKKVEMRVQGKVMSPEYIYPVPSAQQLMPDTGGFAILYVNHSFAQQLFGYEGMVNDIGIRLDSDDKVEEVKNILEDMLKNYGLIDIVERENQVSNKMLESELTQLESMAFLFPVLFLLVASIVIYMLLLRMVENQRRQIGVLMAMGYGKGSILAHYIRYALFIALTGSIAGGILGIWAGRALTLYYLVYFNIPVLQVKVYYNTLLTGILMSAGFCCVAGFNAAKRVLSITPAQAMRPPAPVKGSRWIGERFIPFLRKIEISWRLTFRNLWRNKKRTAFTTFGIAITVAILISTVFFMDAFEFMFDEAFGGNQKYDYKIIFTRNMGEEVIGNLQEFKEVDVAEPIGEYPFSLTNGWREEGAIVIGLNRDTKLYSLKDLEDREVSIPEKGILLSDVLARRLGVKPGDTVTLESPYKPGVKREVKVADIVSQYLGFNGFMDIKYLGSILNEGYVTNGAIIDIKYGSEEFLKRLKDMPYIQKFDTPTGQMEEYMKYLDLMYAYLAVVILFGTIMGFAIIYNTTTINIMERKRELASLRVMGFSKRQVAELIFNENVAVSVLGIIVGLPMGRLMAAGIINNLGEEIIKIPLVIYPRTYLMAVVTVFIFVFLAQLANMRRISKLDLVEVMKSRE